MKNLKYSINAFLLAGVITLTSCGYAAPIVETSLTKEDNIDTSIGNKHYSEKVRKAKIVRESEIETETEATEETVQGKKVDIGLIDELSQELPSYGCELDYFEYDSTHNLLTLIIGNENMEIPDRLYTKINSLLNQMDSFSLEIYGKSINLDLSKLDVSSASSLFVDFQGNIPEDLTPLINLMKKASLNNKTTCCSAYSSTSLEYQELIDQLEKNKVELYELTLGIEGEQNIPKLEDLNTKKIELELNNIKQANFDLMLNGNTSRLTLIVNSPSSQSKNDLVELGTCNITRSTSSDSELSVFICSVLVTNNTSLSIDCDNYRAAFSGNYTDTSCFYDISDAKSFEFLIDTDEDYADFFCSKHSNLSWVGEIYKNGDFEPLEIYSFDDAITVLEDYKEKNKVLK